MDSPRVQAAASANSGAQHSLNACCRGTYADHNVRHYFLCAGQADQVVGILKQEGLESQQQQSHAAACLALGSSLALDPDALFEPCMQALRQMLDRDAHDALQPNEIKIFQTPEGMRLCGACSMQS